MDWNEKLFQESITEWVWEFYVTPVLKGNQSEFGRKLGWTDGRKVRAALAGERRWQIGDLFRIANLLNSKPSYILAQVELFYETRKNNRK